MGTGHGEYTTTHRVDGSRIFGGYARPPGLLSWLVLNRKVSENPSMTTRPHLLTRWKPILRRVVVAIGAGLLLTTTTKADSPPGQDFLVHNWDVDEGLPSTCINAVVRTPDGYVWVGTRHGLARFDGIRFVVFNWFNTPALMDNRIISLATDQRGTLWIGTESGNLSKYEDGRFATVDLSSVSRGSSILSLAVDAETNLWLGTYEDGLIRVKAGRGEAFTNGLPSLNITQVLAATNGRVWFVAAPGQLGWVAAGKCQVPNNTAGLPNSIRALVAARDGGLWLAAQQDQNAGTRIYKYRNGLVTEAGENLPWPQNSWRSRPGALLEDHDGNLWCGTLGTGVFFRPAGGAWQNLLGDPSFSQAETLCLGEDEGSTVWIGTRTSGLRQAVPRAVSTHYLPAANHQNVLLTVCVRHDGSVWGGTDGAGLFHWEDAASRSLGEPAGLAGQQVNALLEDSHSNFWAATSAGLFRQAEGKFQLDQKLTGRTPVYALYEDHAGNVWAGTLNGMANISGDQPVKFIRQNGLPAGPVSVIVEDPARRFWVTVQGQGIYVQTGGRFNRWSPKNGGASLRQRWGNGGNARSLLADADGSIWVATHGDGLFRLEGNNLREWTWEKDGLPSNHFFSMQADGAGNLWFGSENGIVGYARKALLDYQPGNAPPVPWRVTQADGLPDKVCSGGSQPAVARSADGKLWFPDGSALVVFDPATLPRHPQTWPPTIEEVRVDGQLMPPPTTAPFSIHSGVRSLEFYFTSPNILSPNHLCFSYRLEGLDKDWVEAGSRRSAQYSRLPPGEYVFRVKVCDNYGVWNKQQAGLTLMVIPQVWETRWFQMSLALGLLGSAGLAARQLERNRTRRRLVTLERERALERERSRIARDIHDDLGASLTEVALLGDMAGDNSGSPDELREQTRKISTAAREMTQSLEAIVWAVRPENDSLHSLVEYMNRRTDELFEKMPRQYEFIAPSELPDGSIHAEVRHNVFLAYKEALTNSVKYAQASMVRIELACDDMECRIMIADNGRGFDSGAVRAGGTGLKNMRQRMEEIGGWFELESRPGFGTTVRLYFPLPRSGRK